MVNIKEQTSEYLNDLKVNSVLDLGCGKGFKSLRFARKGISVLGVDRKDFGINQESFKFKQEDIREFEFEKKYDLIITSLVLHFFKKEKSIEILKKIQSNTENGGYNFLICMTDQDSCFKEKPDNFYPTLGFLKELYSGWEFVKVDSGFTDYEEHDGTRHRHNLIIALIQKRYSK